MKRTGGRDSLRRGGNCAFSVGLASILAYTHTAMSFEARDRGFELCGVVTKNLKDAKIVGYYFGYLGIL